MAYATGVAANYLDLASKLRDFLTTNVDLVAAGQEWTQIGGPTSGTIASTDFLSFRGEGLTGTDQVLVTVKPFTDTGGNYFNLAARGHTSYNTSAPSDTPLGANSGWAPILLGNSAINYWFIANGRRFIVITKFNSRYDALYAGFILPEHLPSDWSYPLFVGGSCWDPTTPASNSDIAHSNFWHPAMEGSTNLYRSAAYLFSPASAWVPLANIYYPSTTNRARCVYPWAGGKHNVKRLLDGTPWIQRGILFANGNSDQVPEGGSYYGAFDGVCYTPSDGATSEQIITVGGKDYILIQNVFRTDLGRFAAIELG